MKIRTFKWNGDYNARRADAEAGSFDAELAKSIGKQMHASYQLEKTADKQFKVGWSMFTSHFFDVLWSTHAKVKTLSEAEAKVLFLASSDIFQQLEFGGGTTAEKQEDLQKRISELCEMAHEMNLIIDKYHDYDDEAYEYRQQHIDALEEAYQTLFSETVKIYAQ